MPLRVFTPARERPARTNLALTAAQTSVFWVVFVGVIPAGLARLDAAWGLPTFALPAQPWVALAVGLLAAGLNLGSGVALALVGRGTPFPTQTARELVVVGPYRWLRNPMALGGLGVGLAVGLGNGSWSTVAYAVAGGWVWNLVARPLEERDLEVRFGAAYRDYRRAVRCWVPRARPYRAG